MKKIIKVLLILTLVLPVFVNASSKDEYLNGFLLNGIVYNTFLEAYSKANNKDTIILFENVNLDSTLLIDKEITINLNGKTIQSKDSVFKIVGGHLNLIGTGVIKETKPNMYAVLLKGSKSIDSKNYSYVYVGKDVTLEAWAPIFIDKLGKVEENGIINSYNSSFGVKVDIYGTLNGLDDTSGGSGIGIYVNGTVKDKDNYPIINIYDGAEVKGSGVGIYMAGYSYFKIYKAKISGMESGIGIKAGKLLLDGSNIFGTGDEKNPESSSNGINPTGAALQIESNKSYLGNIDINIKNSMLKSDNNSAIVEYIANNTIDTSVINFKISNSNFFSGSNKEKIIASTKFIDKFYSDIENVSISLSNPQILVINKSENIKLILFGLTCIAVSFLIYYTVVSDNKKVYNPVKF